MDIQKEQCDFEQWAFQASGGWASFSKDSHGKYWPDKLNLAWEAWKAAKAQAAPEWISIDELPSDSELVLGISTTKLAKFNVYQVVALDEFEDSEITHWIPLPDSPKAQEQGHG